MAGMYVEVRGIGGHARLVNMATVAVVERRKDGGSDLLRCSGDRLNDWTAVTEAPESFAGLPGFVPMSYASTSGWTGGDGLVNMAMVEEVAQLGDGCHVTFVGGAQVMVETTVGAIRRAMGMAGAQTVIVG